MRGENVLKLLRHVQDPCMVMVCQKIQETITQCTNRGPAALASPWQVADH
jgi:hypothetical protein